MKKLSLIIVITSTVFSALNSHAQKLFSTKTGHVWFFSSTPIENIEAHNKQTTAIINTEKGEIAFAILIKSFEFEKALMQEHFNENYMESDKYPKSTFKGVITNLKDIHFEKDGKYDAIVEGDLTIHNVTKKITVKGTINKKDGAIELNALFQVAPKDYAIQIPKMVENNIAKTIDVHIEAILNSNN